MPYDELRERLRGVAFTTATPFSDDGDRVRKNAIEGNVQTLYDAGARVFIPCGNTGEYYSLSQTERIEVVRSTVDSLPTDTGGCTYVPTIASTGQRSPEREYNRPYEATVVGGAGGSIKNATELLRAYEAVGADAAMIMYPRHTYIHEQGLIDYYRALAEATDLGLVIYKRGPLLTETVLDGITSIENVVAVKYAVNDVTEFSRLVETVSGEVVWLNGVAERFAPAYALEGAEGFTTGIGNFVPSHVLALSRALSEGDWDRAKEVRDPLRPFEDLREETGGAAPFGSAKNVPAVKLGLDLQGLHGGPVREPLVGLSAEDKERVEGYIDEIERIEIG